MNLTTKTSFNTGLLGVIIYALIRFLSFITYNHPSIQEMIAVIIIVCFLIVCLKNIELGWWFLIAEFFLDGAGHFFELRNLLIRTWFLLIFACIWGYRKIIKKDYREISYNKITKSILLWCLLVLFAVINGFLHKHNALYILQDAIVLCFLLLFFPLLDLKTPKKYFIEKLLEIWIIGNAFFSAITFFIYSSGLAHLTDSYYHWFRNDAAGKITDLGNHFFRIVLPDHLLLVPIILMLTSRSIAGEATNKNKVLLLLLLGVLVLNFSRIYFLALPIGLILLYRREKMRQWLLTVTLLFFSLTAIFISTHFLASRGTSFGLELVGLRASGVKNLTSDPSGEIRLAILPDALRQIKERPLFGSGLGASITYVDPGTRLTVTRTQFDWGYLEMIAEFGIIGTLFFVLFYAKLFFAAYAQSKKYADTAHGFAAGIASLCCINITTPALFHGFGILYTLAILFWLQTTKDVCPE